MPDKVVLVTGSRRLLYKGVVKKALNALNPDIVVHGGAPGADYFAHEWCKENGKEAHVFFPDYAAHGKYAPLVRNKAMADYLCTLKTTGFSVSAVAFPLGKSSGTYHCIDCVKRREISLDVVEV